MKLKKSIGNWKISVYFSNENKGGKKMAVRIIEVPSQTVIGLREKGQYRKITEMISKLFEYVIPKKDIEVAGPPIYIKHEITAKESAQADKYGKADIEVCVPVLGNAEMEDDFNLYELSGGTMAKITHRGSYGDCGNTYEEVFKWIKENGYNICGPIREVYLNGPMDVPKEEVLTEIYIPIEK
jgi:effector-binding domain-containing protein